MTYRVLRDTEMARRIKRLYENRCQICGTALRLSDDETYSEGHHVKPLGAPHNGPDAPDNILVLCPNHHVLCDYGSIALSLPDITFVAGHRLDPKCVAYHNEKILGHIVDGQPK